VTYPCTHYQVYDQYHEPALEAARAWFARYL